MRNTATRRPGNPWRGHASALCAVTSLLLFGAPAGAQRFGQWWWEGNLGVGQRSSDNDLDGQRIGSFAQQDLRISLGLNGFLGHPALGDFRLGLDLLFNQLEGSRKLDMDRTGVSLDLSVLPRGSYPVRLFYRRALYDYSGPQAEDPLALLRSSDTTTSWGGRLALRRGPFKGMLLGAERSRFDFLDPNSRQESYDREFLDWSLSGKRIQNHLRLEHRLRDYGAVGFETDDLTLNLDQRSELPRRWTWRFFAVGVRRALTVGESEESVIEDYRLRPQIQGTVRSRDLLDVNADLGSVRFDDGRSDDSRSLSFTYRWRPRETLEIAPFAQYAQQSSTDIELQAPRLGLTLSWSHEGPRFGARLSARGGHGTIESRRSGASLEESATSFGFSASLSHGTRESLRKELELELGRDELRFDRQLRFGFPDLGLSASRPGTQDFSRVRATLGKQLDRSSLTGWVDWSRSESDRQEASGRLNETLSSSLQVSIARLTLLANAGETAIEQGNAGQQDLTYFGARLTWRPKRWLSLGGSYRVDDRSLLFLGEVDSERWEGRLELRAGLLALQARVFETSQETTSGMRTNRGVAWSVSRRFAGWLPIVTGTQRRGEIR